ncbi:MAG TPA: hypothetical protein VK548_20970 [Candidatus Acidoferrum sp.]|nr:hypothetical protein [Candidatus Acidoferrum sp.]
MKARHRVEIIAVLCLAVAGVFTAALATDWTLCRARLLDAHARA